MNTNEQAVELVRLEQQAVELVKEYARVYDEWDSRIFDGMIETEAAFRAMLQGEKNILELGRKLLEADNESTN